MHPDTSKVSQHMYQFGCCTLGRAVVDAVFSEMSKPFAHASSITLAAHAAEIIVKARIAEEHPLLIFDALPKSTSTTDMLSIKELFEYGKTIMYSELPERLWAATGYRMKDVKKFIDFGKLRNTIMHFAVPNKELATETLKFAFEVIDPMLQDFWQDSIIEYTEMWDDIVASEGYLLDQLKRCDIQIHKDTLKEINEKMSWMRRDNAESED